MFDYIGDKIKCVAIVITVIGIIASVILGIRCWVMADGDDGAIILGLCIILFGSILSWLASFLLYGYGELIDKVQDIAEVLSGNERTRDRSYEDDEYDEETDLEEDDEYDEELDSEGDDEDIDPDEYLIKHNSDYQDDDVKNTPVDILLSLRMQGKISKEQYKALASKQPKE